MTIEERNALVERYIPLVRRLAYHIIRSGQRPTIEVDDLVSVGSLSVMQDVAADRNAWAVFQHAKARMKWHITSELQHWNKRKCWSEMFDNNGREKF